MTTEIVKQQVSNILAECQNKLSQTLGKPVNVIYRIKVNSISPELIVQQVCEECKLRYSDIVAKGKQKEFAVARNIIAWLVTYYCGLTGCAAPAQR
jgi:chromosomal replication initiation ATPase DnaA